MVFITNIWKAPLEVTAEKGGCGIQGRNNKTGLIVYLLVEVCDRFWPRGDYQRSGMAVRKNLTTAFFQSRGDYERRERTLITLMFTTCCQNSRWV